MSDAELTSRVTVLAGAAPEVLEQITGPLQGFVCAHMAGHLSPDQRRETLRTLALLLPPGAAGVVTAPEKVSEPETEVVEERRRIGDLDYVARYHLGGKKAGLRAYEVHQGERLLRSVETQSTWRTVTQDELRQDAGEAGPSLEPFSPSLAVLRAPR